MKLKALTKMMNDHGTHPRVNVLKHDNDRYILVYEGKPDNMKDEIANLKVNSFTVSGIGFIKIYTE